MKQLWFGIVAFGAAAVSAQAGVVCATPLEMKVLQSAALQQQLMVAALTCHKSADYNQFVTSFRGQLIKSDNELKKFFAGRPRGEDYNAYKTRVANSASLRSLHDAQFCDSAQKVFDLALGRGEERRGLAPEPPQLIDTGYEGCRPVEDRLITAQAAPVPEPKPTETRVASLQFVKPPIVPAPKSILDPVDQDALALSPIKAAPTVPVRVAALPLVGQMRVSAAHAPVAQVAVAHVPAAHARVAQVPVAQVPAAHTPSAQVLLAQVPVTQVPVTQIPVTPAPARKAPQTLMAAAEPVRKVPRAPQPQTDQPERTAAENPQRYADEQPQRDANQAPQRDANQAPQRYADEQPQRYADEKPQRYADEQPQHYADEQPQRYADEQPQRYADEAPQRYADEEPRAYAPPQRTAAVERPQWRRGDHDRTASRQDRDDDEDLSADDSIPNAYRAGSTWVDRERPAQDGSPPPRWAQAHRRSYLVRAPDGRWVVVVDRQPRWVRD